MLNNAQWLELGIDWKGIHHFGKLESLTIIPGVVFFRAIGCNYGSYSVYYHCQGSSGQLQFTTEAAVKSYLEKQLAARQEYTTLIAKAEALRKRIDPLAYKASIIRDTLSCMVLTK